MSCESWLETMKKVQEIVKVEVKNINIKVKKDKHK